MKQILYFIAALLIAVTFSSCDPGYEIECKIQNNSSHSVTVIPGRYDIYFGNNGLRDTSFDIRLVEPTRTISVFSTGGIGCASMDESMQCFVYYYGDSVTFLFDDSSKVVYHINDTTGLSPYNFDTVCYLYKQNRYENGCPYYGDMTFFIDDRIYQAASKK